MRYLEQNRFTISQAIFYFFIALGFISGFLFRFVQFIAETSMWKDELFSVINIERMSLWELLTEQPAFNQVAGVGFYFIQKVIFLTAGVSTEMVFRLYPFIASLVSIWLFYLIARKFLSGTKLIVSIFLMSSSLGPFIQSANAKPYSGDIMFLMFFVWLILTIQQQTLSSKKYWLYGIFGFMGCLASLPSAVFALISLLFIIIYFRIEKRSLYSVLPMIYLWLLGSILAILYIKLVISPEVSSAMGESHNISFPPTTSILQYLSFFPKQLAINLAEFLTIGTNPFNAIILTRTIIIFILAFTAISYFIKDRSFGNLTLIAPIAMLISFAAFYLYPMAGRTTYFAMWTLLLLPLIGLNYLEKNIKWIKSWLTNGIAILLVFPSVLIVLVGLSRLPIVIDPAKEALKIFQQNKQEGDILYVHGSGDLYMDYYGKKIGTTDFILGKYDADVSPELYSEDLNQLKGKKRVWYFMVGYRPEMSPKLSIKDIKKILDKNSILLQEQKLESFYPSFLNLYDFSNQDTSKH